MSAWAEIDALKNARPPGKRVRWDVGSLTSNWHLRVATACYRYTTKDGEVREWGQHDLARARDWKRVGIVGACVDVLGVLPAFVGEHANRLTQLRKKLTCTACLVAMDAGLEAGALVFDEKQKRIEPLRVLKRPAPLFDRCRMCGGNREVCGHFVGGGAL